MSEPATTLSVPEGHPAHILLDDETHDYPHIEIEGASGIRPEEMRGSRRWWATATVTDHAKPPLHIPGAHMSLTLVNEFLCDRRGDEGRRVRVQERLQRPDVPARAAVALRA